jgi:hypothetical protein
MRLIAEELNMNRETRRQIITEDLGIRKISNLDRWPESMSASHFIWSFTQSRYFWLGYYRWWNAVVSIRPGNKLPEHAVESTEFTSPEKSTHVSLVAQDTASVFLRSQGDGSLRIHCTRQTANQEFHLEVLTRLRESIRRKRPEFWPDK